MEKFQQRFIDEAREYCDRLEQYLLDLEQEFSNQELIGEVFRIMHSLKGSGGMFGFTLVSDLTHDLESLYESVREGEQPLNSAIIDITLRCTDVLRNLLTLEVPDDLRSLVYRMKAEISSMVDNSPAGKETGATPVEYKDEDRSAPKERKSYFICFEPDENVLDNGTNPLYLVDELNTLGDCRVEANMEKVPLPDVLQTEKCYTSWKAVLTTEAGKNEIQDVFLFVQDTSKIEIREIDDPLILQKEDLLRLIFEAGPEVLPEVSEKIPEIRENQSIEAVGQRKNQDEPAVTTIRVNAARIDEYMNLVSEMITAQSRLRSFTETRKDKDLEALAEHFNKLIRQMRDNAFDMSLIPLFNIVTRFNRLVRDLSAELNKEVRLVLEGLDTEIDKSMIEKLLNPMMHIIRNCIDHGIEHPRERINAGKPAAGTILVRAGYAGTFVEIKIEDDGQGLDLDKIRRKAIEKGLLNEQDTVTEKELIPFIFRSGFSTSGQVSEVSGRGVGMDAARKMIRELRGDLQVETERGKGTGFTIRLPLTLSIIDGLLIKVKNEFFIIPTLDIEKIYPLINEKQREKVRQVHAFDGMEIPYLDLAREFYHSAGLLSQQYLIAVKYKSYIFGLVVDEVLREYQAVVKPMRKLMKSQDIFLGVSILGDGKVALVLDTKMVIQKYAV